VSAPYVVTESDALIVIWRGGQQQPVQAASDLTGQLGSRALT
jgi:hypothetical protein